MEASDRICPVVGRRDLGAGYWRVDLEWPELARTAVPGRFAMLRCGEEALLRRPFSIADADPEAGAVAFLGKSIGPGTRWLGALDRDDRVPAIAPLGRGFSWESEADDLLHVLLAGGIGIAPFPLLARRLAAEGRRTTLLFGGRTADDLVCREDFEALGVEVRGIVERGEGFPAGLVTDLLEGLIRENDPTRLRAYSCGPTPMLAACGRILAEAGIPHQTALEEYMACGFGICIGCAVPVHGQTEGEVLYERCCVEGPVFDFERLAW